jgi:hypothetical protein
MAGDTITIELNGEVSLADFSDTIQCFRQLVETLTQDIASGVSITWQIEELRTENTATTIRGVAEQHQVVEDVVAALHTISQCLEQQTPIPYAEDIIQQTTELTRVINGKITSLRLETAQGVSDIVSSRQSNKPAVSPFTRGIVQGTVETLTRHRGYKVILYEHLLQHAVTCYIPPQLAEHVRTIWGQRVRVTGLVGRNADGHPVIVRDITSITLIPDPAATFELARGILPFDATNERSETTIRNLRDSWID